MKPQLREDSVIGLFSQAPLVNFSMVHFSTIYKNVLFLHSPQKKKKKDWNSQKMGRTVELLRFMSAEILLQGLVWDVH